ncbi:hypothetical protein KB874_15070 [Aestuariicoccus sp. KMU-90]|uniref:Uncharacterized protein n=2 Tax=Thetidibacter halocola TaxID=2827239 RepID=A0A8J7WD58_9RHOB|nr:hypothetical protein [Thetidibacter halocola]
MEPLERQMQRALGLPKGTLDQTLRRARRLLPRDLRRAAAALAEARQAEGNPRLARQVDPARSQEAEARLRAWLSGPEPRRRKALHWLGILASFLVSLALGLGMLAALATAT